MENTCFFFLFSPHEPELENSSPFLNYFRYILYRIHNIANQESAINDYYLDSNETRCYLIDQYNNPSHEIRQTGASRKLGVVGHPKPASRAQPNTKAISSSSISLYFK